MSVSDLDAVRALAAYYDDEERAFSSESVARMRRALESVEGQRPKGTGTWQPISGYFAHPWDPHNPHDHPDWHPANHRMGRDHAIGGYTERYCLERSCAYGERLVA